MCIQCPFSNKQRPLTIGIPVLSLIIEYLKQGHNPSTHGLLSMEPDA